MSRRVPLARRVIAAVLLALLTACYSWEPITVSPQAMISEAPPSVVRVTLTNGEVMTVRGPTLRNDSIVFNATGETVASRDVRVLEVRDFSVGKSFGLVGLIGVVVVVVHAALCGDACR